MADNHPSDGDSSYLPAEARELLPQLETLNRIEDIPLRINLIERILTLLPRTDFPVFWAELHVELGDALQQNRQGDKCVQLRQSIACYDTALTVYTREEMPTDRARIQHNKGIVLHELAGLLTGSEREKMLREAIVCFEEILATEGYQFAPVSRTATQKKPSHRMLDTCVHYPLQ